MYRIDLELQVSSLCTLSHVTSDDKNISDKTKSYQLGVLWSNKDHISGLFICKVLETDPIAHATLHVSQIFTALYSSLHLQGQQLDYTPLNTK